MKERSEELERHSQIPLVVNGQLANRTILLVS